MYGIPVNHECVYYAKNSKHYKTYFKVKAVELIYDNVFLLCSFVLKTAAT